MGATLDIRNLCSYTSASLVGFMMILENIGVINSARTPYTIVEDPAMMLRTPVLDTTTVSSSRDNIFTLLKM